VVHRKGYSAWRSKIKALVLGRVHTLSVGATRGSITLAYSSL
jgi:hypothetical protein